MNKSTTLPIPRKGDEKRYSLNQIIGTLTVAIFATFICGTIFGLKIGSHPNRSVISSEAVQIPEASTQSPERIIPSYEDRTRSSPEKEAAWDRAMAARRAELGNQRDSYGTRTTEDSYTGKHPIDAYRPEADDVARHWENETGKPISRSDVETIQWLMKTIDDKK